MLLTDLVAELYRRLNGVTPDPDTVSSIDQLADDYDLDDEHVPRWLIDAFQAVLAGRPTEEVWFPRVGSDAGSFLYEAAPLVPGWQYKDEGEYATMSFPSLGWEIYISREARSPEGKSCSSIRVRPL